MFRERRKSAKRTNSERVEKTMDDARRQRWTALNLGGWKLTSLPSTIGECHQLQQLSAIQNSLRELPDAIGKLANLQYLSLSSNDLQELPETIGRLRKLKSLKVDYNQLRGLPEKIGQLHALTDLKLRHNNLQRVPSCIRHLPNLHTLDLRDNHIAELPAWLAELKTLRTLWLAGNPLMPEVAAALKAGTEHVKAYLRERERSDNVSMHEAKLTLVGEGGVGKSSLLAALGKEHWQEKRKHTLGVDLSVLELPMEKSGTILRFNAWDFAGQPVYRATHQLFFSAPAIFLVVWNPRFGPESCSIDYWIDLIRRRTYDGHNPEMRPRILVVATHGGPEHPHARIDETALKERYGDLISGFCVVDSNPDSTEPANPDGLGIQELRRRLVRMATDMNQVTRMVTTSWKRIRRGVRETREQNTPQISREAFTELCARKDITDPQMVDTYLVMLRQFGHIVHFPEDEDLRNVIVIKPAWITEALRDLLEDEDVGREKGLVHHSVLMELWSKHGPEHVNTFRRLMEKFDISYVVTLPNKDADAASLIAQLVPGDRPKDLQDYWPPQPDESDRELVHICRILDRHTGSSASSRELMHGVGGWAEGLMHRLIVKLHRYSIGKDDFRKSQHWRTGLVLDDGHNGRALLEQVGGDIHVTVRAAYPEHFMHFLCKIIKEHVEFFWTGLMCRIAIRCPENRNKPGPCIGSFDISELIESQVRSVPEVRCNHCTKWFPISDLLNASNAIPTVSSMLDAVEQNQQELQAVVRSGFSGVRAEIRKLATQVDERYELVLNALSDEAREGPRLISLVPDAPEKWSGKSWTHNVIVVTLWCERMRLPVPLLTGNPSEGVYRIKVPKAWLMGIAPYAKLLAGTLRLVLPFANPLRESILSDATLEGLRSDLALQQAMFESLMKSSQSVSSSVLDKEVLLPHAYDTGYLLENMKEVPVEYVEPLHATGALLRELHQMMAKEDPSRRFGGLQRVQTRLNRFEWVHPMSLMDNDESER